MLTVRRAGFSLAFLAVSVLAAGSVLADTAAISCAPGVNATNGHWSLGFEFTVNSPIAVTQLGYYDDLGNGLTESHDVGIYDLSGNLLTSATVTPGDSLDSLFRYTTLGTPLNLATGNYVISAETGSENYSYFGTQSTASEITYVQDRYTPSSTLAYAADSAGFGGANGNNGWYGPNLKFGANAAVPEPGSVALLIGMSVSGAGFLLRLKRRK